MARCNPVLCVLVAALLGTILAALVEASAGSTLTSGDWMQRTIYQVASQQHLGAHQKHINITYAPHPINTGDD